MILTEAVISGAFAAVTELQIGIIGVGAAADGALMTIALLLLLLTDRLSEVHRLAGVVMPLDTDETLQLRPDKEQKVEQCCDRQNYTGPVSGGQGGDHNKGIINAVDDGKPFHLNGDDEKQHHLHIREQDSKGQEQGQIDKMGSGQGEAIVSGNKTRDDSADDGENHAGDVIESKACGAPFTFQRRADPVVEIEGEQHEEGAAVHGEEDKRYDAPNLAPEQAAEIEGQKGQGGGIFGTGEQCQQIHNDIACHHIEHQARDAEVGMPGTESVYGVADLGQVRDLLA